MGVALFDKFSVLHFSTGMLWYYLGFNMISLLIVHIIFEIVENSKPGMLIINKYFKLWPGGKPRSDSIVNIIGDIIISLIGFIIAYKFINKNLGLLFSIISILYFWTIGHYIK